MMSYKCTKIPKIPWNTLMYWKILRSWIPKIRSFSPHPCRCSSRITPLPPGFCLKINGFGRNKKIKALNHKKTRNEENTPEGYHSFCLTVVILERPGYIASMMSMSSQGLCLNRTNGKDNRVRLRTTHKRSVKTVQNLTLILILTAT